MARSYRVRVRSVRLTKFRIVCLRWIILCCVASRLKSDPPPDLRDLKDSVASTGKYVDVIAPSQDFIAWPRDTHVACANAWNDFSQDFHGARHHPVSLVITFCKHPLEWVNLACSDISFNALTLYSKCGHEDLAQAFMQSQTCSTNATLLKLPNVGRVDHAIAYHISNLPPATDGNELILFVKDTFLKVHQRRSQTNSFQEMLTLAAGPLGFGCGLKPTASIKPRPTTDRFRDYLRCIKHLVKVFFGFPERNKNGLCSPHDANISLWHKTDILTTYTIKAYERNFGGRNDEADFRSDMSFANFLRSSNLSLPTPLSAVCYGGSFASKVSHILKIRESAFALLKHLSRGDNIIEGHFAERSWAAILTARLPVDIQKQLISMSKTTFPFMDMYGALFGCA